MPANIITTDDLRQFKIELIEELRQLFSNTKDAVDAREFLKTSEVSKLLNISLSKLHHLRVSRALPYTKIGATIYYRRDDIYQLLEKNKKDAKVKSLSSFKN